MPKFADSFAKARVLADLAFCASGLHPIVTRLRIPQFFCDTPDGTRRVFEMADVAMRPNFALLDAQLAKTQWWYGERWSIVDAYINWIWFRVSGTEFDASGFTNLARHNEEVKQRPSVARALRISERVAKRLAEQGLAAKFSGTGAVTAATF